MRNVVSHNETKRVKKGDLINLAATATKERKIEGLGFEEI
jgi:hypothetical protein